MFIQSASKVSPVLHLDSLCREHQENIVVHWRTAKLRHTRAVSVTALMLNII